MHTTKIVEGCLGPHIALRQLTIGQFQSMVFSEDDVGPFDMSSEERASSRETRLTGNKTTRALKKGELLRLLREKTGREYKACLTPGEVQEISIANGIALEVEEDEKVEGWLGKPKGLLQVLYERGWIDPQNVKKYVKDKRKAWLDDEKKIKPECQALYEQYSLTYLMAQCQDFKAEKSAMEKLADDLTTKGDARVYILVSPKYHCELAGEGIEYAWGFAKKVYRNLPFERKKGKANFHAAVRQSLHSVSIDTMRKFSAKARRYMLVYKLFDSAASPEEYASKGMSYREIERFVDKLMKVHRSAADQDTGFITKTWREAQGRVDN